MEANLYISNSDMERFNNTFKKFFLKFIFLFLVFCLADQLSGHILRYFYFKQSTGGNSRTRFTIESANEDILVFGSSRASHHYEPVIFEEKLKMTFYNTGRDGHFLLFNYGVLKATLNRYAPKIVIFDVRPNDLYYVKTDYDNLFQLLPYYKDHPEIRSIIYLRSSVEKFKLISAVYPFNSEIIQIIINNITFNKERYSIKNGYIPLYGILKGEVPDFRPEVDGIIDENKINALKDIASICKQKSITLLFICSPIYRNSTNIKNTLEIMKIAETYQSRFWDFENDSVFTKHPEYFDDISHLNDIGANLFSREVAERIDSIKHNNGGITQTKNSFRYYME